MVKIRQLEYLVSIVDTASFGQAALVTNASQPTLSQQIRVLEEELGTRLLERGAGGVIPTPVGRAVVDHARRILREVGDLKGIAQRGATQLSGTVRLGTTPTLGPYLLSPTIAALHRRSPDLRLYVREGIPSHQALELARGQIDLLLGPMPVSGDGLTVEPLFREPLLPVVAVDHPLAKARDLRKEDLAGQTMLSLDARHHFHQQLTQVANDHAMTISPDYEGTSLDTLHQMVASGLGMTLLPALYLASEVGGSSSIKLLRIPGWRVHRSIALAWRRSSALDLQYQALAQTIGELSREILADFEAAWG